MKIKKATRSYEEWLSKLVPLIQADLDLKHARMAQEPFSFLRATYYRWAQLWPEVCQDLAAAYLRTGVESFLEPGRTAAGLPLISAMQALVSRR
jgi:hypothetical protein